MINWRRKNIPAMARVQATLLKYGLSYHSSEGGDGDSNVAFVCEGMYAAVMFILRGGILLIHSNRHGLRLRKG